MINKTIKVEYLINKGTGKVGFNYNDIAELGQKPYLVDALEKTAVFTKFKNNGQVSKTEANEHEIVNHKVEELLQQELEIEASREVDQARAIELAHVINRHFINNGLSMEGLEWDMVYNGNFSDNLTPGWTTIKAKTSHSSWYQHGGKCNSASIYHTQVPIAVESEARELQSIRRKHQNGPAFDFIATDYCKRIVREADHDD